MKFKVFADVFDNATIAAINKLANDGYIDRMYGVIKTGKEANVFYGIDAFGNEIAIKIYRIETSDYKNMWLYIKGDHRFDYVKMRKKDIVIAWAKKEFKNMQEAAKAGLRVPIPYAVRRNVLVMEFIGKEGVAAPKVKDLPPSDPKRWFETLKRWIKDLYHKAELVHADLNEYNILNYDDNPVLIDWGQAVHRSHPQSLQLLRRDVHHLLRFFKGLGIEDREEVLFKWVCNKQ